MTANNLLLIIICFVVLEFIFGKVLDFLNSKSWSNPLPRLVEDLYDKDKYSKAKNYAKDNGNIALLSSVISLATILSILIFKGFGSLDSWINGLTANNILQSLLFFGMLSLGSFILNLPFSLYKTFVIEEKYGFNQTTLKTYILDFFKSLMLSILIGGAILSALTWVYYQLPNSFWWIAWIIMTMVSLFFATFYTTLILPLFNKLEPLEDGSLRKSIESYASKVDFPLTNIFVIDGSKRSSKANAFFSGLGKKKAIVLYDTLMKDNTEEELTAILAHEVGHYKKNHIKQGMILGVIQTGVLFFLFGLLSSSSLLVAALGASSNSFHIALIGFSMLYSPISLMTGIGMNLLSRKNEFEADNFAKETYNGEPLQTALKNLSVNHLSNLTPHPSYVFVHYSHPPLIARLEALQ
ncbi:MAG: M48 family metallopeptidase [Chitinophagales bacterium]|nr:M48 family metallopeptidase [Chitinophagales bacterium]MDC3209653.1 M48 family metallopeptidase [Chitinophagales bacterium]